MTLLDVEELRVRVATDDAPLQIVDGVSYEVGEGRVFGIAGESGSGKTVSVLALMGLLPKGATVTGTARFEGNDLVSMPSARLRQVCGREIGLVFQDPLTSFHPMLSIGRQLTEHLRHHYGTSRADARARARRAPRRGADPRSGDGVRAVSARVLGRDAPTDRDRRSADVRAAPPDRGRADDRARRHRPGRASCG